MKSLAATHRFKKDLKRLPPDDQTTALKSLKILRRALESGDAPVGLGFKKISADQHEIRAGLRLRIVMQRDGDILVCHLIGNHEDVRRSLRS